MSKFSDAEFKLFENKIDDVLKLLHEMTSNENPPSPKTVESSNIEAFSSTTKTDEDDENSFIVKVRENRTIINKTDSEPELQSKEPHTVDKFTFMNQLEKDADMRAENRRNRQVIAENFRRLGNAAYRDQRFEEAIKQYSKAIDHVKDSPILYNNRALTYIKLGVYKRALIDCDFVLNHLDDKNLRSWLYRAVAYFNLDDTVNYEKSVKMAKKNNTSEIDYINSFIKKVRDI